MTFTVYRNAFPFGSLEALDVLQAADHTAAAKAAKRRWPGVPLVITKGPRKRSASSTAYRAFLVEKRAEYLRRRPLQTLTSVTASARRSRAVNRNETAGANAFGEDHEQSTARTDAQV
jgi:hypothetical protein